MNGYENENPEVKLKIDYERDSDEEFEIIASDSIFSRRALRTKPRGNLNNKGAMKVCPQKGHVFIVPTL